MPTTHQPLRTVGGITNAERAQQGGDALLAFAVTQYHHESGEEIPTALGDLMCSLLHYLASMGFDDPVRALQKAMHDGEGHYVDETVNEPHEDAFGEIATKEPPFADAPLYDPAEWMRHQRG